MALITEIIKKYEMQAKERISEARQARAKTADTIILGGGPGCAPVLDIGMTPTGPDLSTKSPTEQDFAYFDWQNKLVEFHKNVKNANFILQELNNASNVLGELQRLREENAQLKDKLNQYEQR